MKTTEDQLEPRILPTFQRSIFPVSIEMYLSSVATRLGGVSSFTRSSSVDWDGAPEAPARPILWNQEKEAQVAKPSRRKKRHIGLVSIDMLSISFPVFLTVQDAIDDLLSRGYDIDPGDFQHNVFGSFMELNHKSEPRTGYAMVITKEASVSTWAHEASHAVDFIMERLGMPSDISNTETRAYMLGHIVSEIQNIMIPVLSKLEPET